MNPTTHADATETEAQTANHADLEGRLGIDRAGLYSLPACAGCREPLRSPTAADAEGRVYCGECAEDAAEVVA